VLDEAAIQRLISLYSQSYSIGDIDAVVALYLPDGIWDIPHLGMKPAGHAALRDALTRFAAAMDYVLQMNAPAIVEVTGNRATARSGIRICGKSAERDEGFEHLGIYADEIVRTADGWKICEAGVRMDRHA
jgi:ketosteroid isomerase-like protein